MFENFGAARGDGTEPHQCLDQGGLARAVGPQQADGAARESNSKILQDITFPETHAQARQFDDRLQGLVRFVFRR